MAQDGSVAGSTIGSMDLGFVFIDIKHHQTMFCQLGIRQKSPIIEYHIWDEQQNISYFALHQGTRILTPQFTV
jgi:hypothetical protein